MAMVLPTLLLLSFLDASKVEAVFPALQFPDLNKKAVSLPGGLNGERNLVIIAFERKQQNDIDTWLAVLPAMLANHPKVAYYELPVIDKMNGMMRWFINNGMRGGIPDPAQRERTITLYTDKKVFREALRIPDEKRIYLLMLNKAGEVLWRTEGVVSPDKQQALKDYLAAS